MLTILDKNATEVIRLIIQYATTTELMEKTKQMICEDCDMDIEQVDAIIDKFHPAVSDNITNLPVLGYIRHHALYLLNSDDHVIFVQCKFRPRAGKGAIFLTPQTAITMSEQVQTYLEKTCGFDIVGWDACGHYVDVSTGRLQ